MSETEVQESVSALQEVQVNEPSDFVIETNDDWDTELTDLVRENADVLVQPSWLAVELPLGAAMYHTKITRDNVNLLASEVRQLLANRPEEKEELDEEEEPEEPEEEETAETEAEEVGEKDANAAEAERQSEKETVETKHSEPPSIREEQTPRSDNSVVEANNADAPVSSSSNSQDTSSRDSAGVPETIAVINSTSGTPAQEPTFARASDKNKPNESRPAIKPKVDVPDIPKKDLPVSLTTEAKPALNKPKLVIDEKIEPSALPPVAPSLNLEPETILSEMIETGDKVIEEAEDEPALDIIDYQLDIDTITDFAEGEEDVLDYFEETALETDEPQEIFDISLETVGDNLEAAEDAPTFELGNELNLFGQIEATGQEQLVQTGLAVEEIEDSLIRLAELVKTSDPETAETIYGILDKIIEVPVKFEDQNGETMMTEDEATEELEDLFTELFDRLEIGYTPELIESLARLTLKWHLIDEIEQLKNEEPEKILHDTGTHEIIKKLLAGLSVIKKAMAHACSIGKSALQLYSFSFAA